MSKPRLLMLLSRHPFAERSGRASMLRQRIAQARLRFETRLVVFGEPAGDASDKDVVFLPFAQPLQLAANALRMGDAPLQTWLYYDAAIAQRIGAMARDCAALYVDMLRLAPLTAAAPAHVARIVDYDDLLSTRYARAVRGEYDVLGFLAQRFGPLAGVARLMAAPILAAETRRIARFERAVAQEADLILFTSPREADAFRPHSAAPVQAAPPLTPIHPAPPPGERLIFLGNMRYGENVVMLRSLAAAAADLGESWPDDLRIEVVGDAASDLPARFDPVRFRFLGRIADLASLAGAGIFLAPVTSGSGVKLKVLDGLALGCPVVTTPQGCEGLSVRANRDVLVCETPAAVLRTAIALRRKPALRALLAQRAQAYVARAHAPELGAHIADAMAEAAARANARQDTL